MDKQEKTTQQEEEVKIQNGNDEAQSSESKAEEQEATPRTEEEKLKEELDKANEVIAEQKDKYLRLSAEFDNYRKRTMKESRRPGTCAENNGECFGRKGCKGRR